MADYAFKGYDNEVLAEQIESILSTKMDMNRFMTADYSLSENAGMKKVIHKYTGTGAAEDLERGEGNTEFVDAEYKAEEYVVNRTQATSRWFDDDAMTDPRLIEAKVQYLAEGMVNNWTAKAVAEFNKSENMAEMSNFDLADFADAINEYTKVYEDQAGLFFLANIEMIPVIRKQLGDYLKYTEAYIRTGAVGDILGVPVYTSKAVPKGIMFLATKDAVTAFIKKNVFVEQDRDIDKKENKVVAARYAVIALTDESKCVKCGKAQSTALTASATTAGVSGAATTGAKVYAYDEDGLLLGSATAASSTYSISVVLASGDKVKVVAEKEGFLPAIANAEVA